MVRKFFLTGCVVGGIFMYMGCDNGTGPEEVQSENRNVLFSENFEEDLSAWEAQYMVTTLETYNQMRITTDAAHDGKSSLTSDSNMTALYHVENVRQETGVVGIEFYMMATELSQANFGVQMGQNPGSSGAVSPAFGIYFDPSDSIKCVFFTTWPRNDVQVMVAPIEVNKWYKCQVEVDFSTYTAKYIIDADTVYSQHIPTEGAENVTFHGLDRLVVLRGKYGKALKATDGEKPYYVDDITFYSSKTEE